MLRSPERRLKASLRSPQMLPRLAVVDPELTLDLPPALTASTGLDALTQIIEPYVSIRDNAMTDLYCAEGLRLAASALRRAWALANAGLGAVHGFAARVLGVRAGAVEGGPPSVSPTPMDRPLGVLAIIVRRFCGPA